MIHSFLRSLRERDTRETRKHHNSTVYRIRLFRDNRLPRTANRQTNIFDHDSIIEEARTLRRAAFHIFDAPSVHGGIAAGGSRSIFSD